MAARSDTVTPEAARSGVLPPWLWFWLIVYIVGFSALFENEKPNFLIIISGSDGTSSIAYNFVERWVSGGVVLNDLVLFIGVLAVFLPWLRTLYLERKFELADRATLPAITSPMTLQTLDEVSNFIREYAPDVIIKYSAVKLQDYAFVYPIGYRRAGIALSAPLLALWRKDRLAAQAILLHEIAHYRHGDTFIVGAGSLLEAVVKYLVPFNALFIVIPLVLSFIVEHVQEIQSEMKLAIDVHTIIAYHLQHVITFDIPSLFLAVLQSLFRAAMIITLVLIAIWCAELNADRFVMDTTHSTQALAQAMEQHAAPRSWWRWLLSRTSHPPIRMRQWFVQQSQSTVGLVLFLLIFPAASFVRLFFLIGWAFGNLLDFLPSGVMSIGSIGATLGIGIIYYLEALVPSWIAMAALFLLWPFLTRLWERLFARIPGRLVNIKYRAYVLSAGIVACVCLLGFVLSILPTPASASATSDQPVVVKRSPVVTQNSPGVTQGSSSGHFQVGKQVKVADMWIVQVTQVQIQSDNGLTAATPGKAYLAIDVSLKNISAQSYTFSSSLQFILHDLQGVQYDQTFIAAVPPPELSTPAHDGRVAPGASIHGRLTYEIPVGIHQFTLSFEADWLNYDPATSQLTIWDINAHT